MNDWVIGYTLVIFTILYSVSLIKHGQPQYKNWNVGDAVIETIIYLPLIGRVFNWW